VIFTLELSLDVASLLLMRDGNFECIEDCARRHAQTDAHHHVHAANFLRISSSSFGGSIGNRCPFFFRK
jgi:hypothetical protein